MSSADAVAPYRCNSGWGHIDRMQASLPGHSKMKNGKYRHFYCVVYIDRELKQIIKVIILDSFMCVSGINNV